MKINHATPIIRAALCGVLFLTFTAATITALRAADKAPARDTSSSLNHALLGKWNYSGEPGKIVAPPAKGGFVKLRTPGHWAAIAIDERSGLVTSTHGGTWRVNGNTYEETVEYGNQYHAELMGKTYTWTVVLEGGTLTKTGVNNPWHEVWTRVK